MRCNLMIATQEHLSTTLAAALTKKSHDLFFVTLKASSRITKECYSATQLDS